MSEIYRLKNIVNLLPKSTIKATEGNNEGVFPFFTSSQDQNKFLDDYKYDCESLILGTGGFASVHYYNGKFSVSTDCIILNISDLFFSKYVYYFLKDQQKLIDELGFRGVGIKHLQKDFLYNLKIENYDFEYQVQIANYLDNKTKEIDNNISKNKELISLLEEKKVALINQCVTKGLNPDVPMKDSGIEWIGEIPEHWEINRLKNVSDIIMGQSPNSEDITDDSLGVLFMQGNAEFGKIYPHPTTYCINPKKLSRKDDILMSVRAPVGDLNISDEIYCIGRGLCSIRPFNFNQKFLWYFLLFSKSYFDFYSNGSTFEAITIDTLLNLFTIIPIYSEQKEIADYLDDKVENIDEIINKVQSQIDLLEEYKQSLIHHVVTGKVDVREVEV